MEQKDIQLGAEYGYRERPRVRSPLDHVRVVERVRGKWRVEWIEPNGGLQDFVPSSCIVVPWKKRKGFLADEEAWQVLRAESAASWPGHQHPVDDAVSLVLEATGETLWCGRGGVLSGERDALERVATRARITLDTVAPAFQDGEGASHMPFTTALKIVRAFAAAEPSAVLAQIKVQETEISRFEREYDAPEMTQLHNRYLAGWALVREWAGFDAAVADQVKEIESTQENHSRLSLTLRRTGHDDLAGQLERMAR